MADYLIKLKKLKFTVLSFVPSVTGENAEGFLFDAAQFRFVYTDASMIWNREGEPACGVGVYFNAANPSNKFAPVAPTDPMDNNAAKVRAGIVGMNTAKAQGFEKLIIVTNSNFFVEALTTHLHQWLLKWPQTGPIVSLIRYRMILFLLFFFSPSLPFATHSPILIYSPEIYDGIVSKR